MDGAGELYLHVLAERDFDVALRGLLGDRDPIGAGSVARLKAQWQLEYDVWRTGRLDDIGIVYCWADGVYGWSAINSFPSEHWVHLRTTNPVESPFAAVRLRTTAGKRYKKVENATALIWKLLLIAEQTFRRPNAPELLPAVAAEAVT